MKQPESSKQKSRNQLAIEHLWLVRLLRRKNFANLPPHIEDADLYQAGMLGLLDAADRFDPKKGVKFQSYADLRIVGAMVDYIREQDWTPRRLSDLRKRASFRKREVEQRIGGRASDAEVADEMGITVDFYRSRMLQIEMAKTGGDAALVPVGFNSTLEDDETMTQVWDAVDGLADKWKVVLTLYYREDMTYLEIADRLGLTESRICQIHTVAIQRLRAALRRVRSLPLPTLE